MILSEYTTQRSIYENGDPPTNNSVTSDVPDLSSPKKGVSQFSNVSMNNSTQYRTRTGRVNLEDQNDVNAVEDSLLHKTLYLAITRSTDVYYVK